MSARDTSSKRVQFGVFELDLQRAELRKQGVKVKLQEQPLKVLQLLLQNAGQIVTREQLRHHVWPANTFVEFDQGLYSAMARLRDALGDSPDSPRYIETVARHGYRFIAPVVSPPDALPVPSSHDLLQEHLPAASKRGPAFRFVVSLLAGLAGGALFLTSILAFNLGGARSWLQSRTHPIRSIAVLPLENLSGDAEQEYFVDGMTDELITGLAKLGSVRVVSRTSVMRFKKVSKPVADIGRELNVDALVEGTVERVGSHVRIRVQLVHADADQHLWAQTYDRDLRDTLLLQSEAAGDIVREIQRNLTPPQRRRLATARLVDPEAYEAYLKGLYFSNKRSAQNFQRAISYFEQAVAKDPGYALAYSGLSDAVFGQVFTGTPVQKIREKTKSTAMKAVALDPSLSEAHNSVGGVREFFDWDWAAAETEYLRAIELNDNSVVAHQDYAQILILQGRVDQGLAEAQRSQELDPLSAFIRSTYCMDLMLARRYEKARQKCQEALELDPQYYHADCHLAQIDESTGKYDQSFAEFEKCAIAAGEPPARLAAMKQSFQRGGIKALWRKQLELSLEQNISNKDRYYDVEDTYQVAALYSLLGEPDSAIAWLQKAYNDRSILFDWVRVDPSFDSIRSDSRFVELLRRANLN
jgi:TolB-like protein/DNA-binding winged helix-turn-helix (wHTH) protein